jgi:hypothetical protein
VQNLAPGRGPVRDRRTQGSGLTEGTMRLLANSYFDADKKFLIIKMNYGKVLY